MAGGRRASRRGIQVHRREPIGPVPEPAGARGRAVPQPTWRALLRSARGTEARSPQWLPRREPGARRRSAPTLRAGPPRGLLRPAQRARGRDPAIGRHQWHAGLAEPLGSRPARAARRRDDERVVAVYTPGMQNGDRVPALVLGAGVSALAVIRSLGRSGVPVFAAGADTTLIRRS